MYNDVMRNLLTLLCLLCFFCLGILLPPSEGKANQAARQSNTAQPTEQSTGGNTSIFRSISPQQASQLLNSRNDILFLDVRTLNERARALIPGSQHVSIGSLFRGTSSLPKDEPLLLVCAVGGRSYAIGKILSTRGYREIYNLSGGIKAWYQAGLPVTFGTQVK